LCSNGHIQTRGFTRAVASLQHDKIGAGAHRVQTGHNHPCGRLKNQKLLEYSAWSSEKYLWRRAKVLAFNGQCGRRIVQARYNSPGDHDLIGHSEFVPGALRECDRSKAQTEKGSPKDSQRWGEFSYHVFSLN
jgi:hypothetical protein